MNTEISYRKVKLNKTSKEYKAIVFHNRHGFLVVTKDLFVISFAEDTIDDLYFVGKPIFKFNFNWL